MNDQIRALGIRLTADAAQLNAEMREVRREIAAVAKAVEDAAGKMESSSKRGSRAVSDEAKAAKAAQKEQEKALRAELKATEDAYKRQEQAISRVKMVAVGTLALIGKQVYDVGMGFLEFKQNSELAFTTMLGSGDKARTFLADVLAFAKETPFAFTDLADSAQRMLAFGIESEKIIPILRTLGDTALGTGGGVEKLNGIVTAISQISAKGRLQAEEMLQLSERGVPALNLLANKAGVTAGVFQKQVTKGLIDADQAIEWLVDGLQNGTEGINGTTAAFDGLMKKMKESGGITATFDSAKSAFRTMSGEVMESLLPSIITLVNAGSDLMGVVKTLADMFNSLPKPVRDVTLAVTALMIAKRLLRTEMGQAMTGAFRAFGTGIADSVRGAAAYTSSVRAMTTQMGVARTSMAVMKTSLSGMRTALMGAFGGPVGLAIAGVTMALAAYSSGAAEAKARTQELKGTLDDTGNATAETARLIAEKMSEIREFDWKKKFQYNLGDIGEGTNLIDDAKKIGLAAETYQQAAMGNADALEVTLAAIDAAKESGDWWAAFRLEEFLEENIGALDKARKATKDKKELDEAGAKSTEKLGSAYANAARQAINFADSNDVAAKAVESAAEAAAKAFSQGTSAMGFKLNLASDKDVENARDAVTKATNSVKDAEGSLSKARSAKKPDAETIRRAEQALADARKAAKEASDNLADTEKRNDPVGTYRKQLQEQRKAAEQFRDDMIKLAEQGLNGQSLQELLTQGVEGSADTRKALLGDKKLIGETNDYQTAMDSLAGEIETIARLNATRMNTVGGITAEEFNLGMRIAMEEGASTSLSSLADKLGEDPSRIREIGRLMGLEFVAGFSDAGVPWAPTPQKGFPLIPGYASGGIYPGYTPGRDIGFIGISGGEAIMRPEFTRAVGADWVHRMNALARSVGVGGVRKEMSRYLGGFASGGIPAPRNAAPQVIRLTESQTVGYPMTVEHVTIQTNDMADFERQMRAARRRAFTGGRP